MLPNEPYFLWYAAAFVSALAACRFVVSRADRTDKPPMLPMQAQLNPYELAYLRGGRNAVERLAILELLERGYLRTRQQKASFWLSRPARTILEQAREGQDLPWYLNTALRYFTKPQGTEAISGLWDNEWKRLEKEIEERLNKDQLLVLDETKSASLLAKAGSLTILGILSVPILPVISGLFSNALGFFGLLAVGLVLAACDAGRLSKRGAAYLEQLQNAYRENTVATLPSGTAAAGVTFTLVIEFALFGGEVLKGTPYEDIDGISDSGDSGDGGDGGGDGD